MLNPLVSLWCGWGNEQEASLESGVSIMHKFLDSLTVWQSAEPSQTFFNSKETLERRKER